MQSLLSKIVTACLTTAFLAAPVMAAKKDKQRDATASLQKKLQKADLPAASREKADKVIKEHAAKIKEAQAAVDALLTAEQKSAVAAAKKSTKEAGKKRKDAQADIAAALKLSDEQRTKYQAAQKDLQKAQSDLTAALKSALSSEELAKAGIKVRKKNKA
jgi:Skp family chaperone for outer membrane proteins